MNRLGWTLLGLFVAVGVGFVALVRTGSGVSVLQVAPVREPLSPTPTITRTGFAVPVAGILPSQLVESFDDPRGDGRTHGALDIMAAKGTPVLAATSGKIERLFESGRGGHTVYLRSGDGRYVTYYAHLDAYAPSLREGQGVRQGQLLGTVGSSGDASAEGPHLHFEIKRMGSGDRWDGGTAIDPFPLLAGRGAGG